MATEAVTAGASIGSVISSLAAVVSVVCVVLSYRLNRRINDQNIADDRLVIGNPYRPELREREHSKSVICLEVFNKSKRKASIESLAVYDRKSKEVDVTWSGSMSALGTPEDSSGILGIVDSSTIYIRRNDGENFEYARITFKHSFSENRVLFIFEEFADLLRAAERG